MKRTSTDAEYLDSGRVVIDADGIPVELGYRGTGSPEGNVAAPVGTIYTDTAATNGAIRWVKASGTGNTGWRVEYGDTGWRVIANNSTHPTTIGSGEILIRRLNSSVEVVVYKVNANDGTLGEFIPSGFRPVRRLRPTLYRYISSTPDASTQLTSMGYFNFYGDLDEDLSGSIVYTTTNPWPSSLPGIPD